MALRLLLQDTDQVDEISSRRQLRFGLSSCRVRHETEEHHRLRGKQGDEVREGWLGHLRGRFRPTPVCTRLRRGSQLAEVAALVGADEVSAFASPAGFDGVVGLPGGCERNCCSRAAASALTRDFQSSSPAISIRGPAAGEAGEPGDELVSSVTDSFLLMRSSPSTPISCPGTASSDEELRTAHKLPESNRSSARLHWQNTAQSAARSSLCCRRGTGAARKRGSRPIFRQQLNKVKAPGRAAKNVAEAEIAKFPGKNDIFALCDSLAQRLPKRESRAMLLALHSLGSSSPRPSPDGTGTAGRGWSRTCFGMIPGKPPPTIRSAVSEPLFAA